jgi:hypothetical protein
MHGCNRGRFHGIKQNLLGLKFILEVGHQTYKKLSDQKIFF